MTIMTIENLSFAYRGSDRKIIDDLSMSFEDGTVYALVGKSGAGKTTLLSLLSALTKPTEGKILVRGKNIFDGDTYAYRASDVGIVFQNYNLLPNLNAVENVVLSMDIAGVAVPDRSARATELLADMGIESYDLTRPVQTLSGGQQQRVAIARAISYDAPIILADEPTGNLDSATEKEILDIFETLAHRDGKCVIIVSHSQAVANMADQVIDINHIG